MQYKSRKEFLNDINPNLKIKITTLDSVNTVSIRDIIHTYTSKVSKISTVKNITYLKD